MESILKIWLTPSGAIVTLLLVFLIVSLCAFFSTGAQRVIFQILAKGVRGKWGAGEIELGRPVPSKSTGDLPAGEAAPTPRDDDAEAPGFRTSIAPPSTSDDRANNSESALRTRMLIASVSRDHEAFQNAYQALISMRDRDDSEAVVTTYKLLLEHRMGDDSAAPKLARLADANPTWYEPCQALASLYYLLGSYDKRRLTSQRRRRELKTVIKSSA
jgi:hypothetical protein